MKMLFGQFTIAQVKAMQEAMAHQFNAQAMIVPYFGDRDVQVIELPRKRQPRRSISIKAHTP